MKLHFRLLLLSFLSLIPLQAGFAADSLDFYVSPNGSDKNPGSISKPFATLERARDAVRLSIVGGLSKDVKVNLRGGTYNLTKTLVLGLKDSAPVGYTITWQGYANEKAILSSGVKVSGWKKLSSKIDGLPESAAGNVWVADIPQGLGRILTLYKGDSRLDRVRTEGFAPDTDIHPRDNPDETMDMSTLYFPEGAVKNWPNLEDAELLILPSFPWWMNILSFASVDEKNRVAKTTIPGTDFLCPMVKYARRGFEKNAWVENVPEGLESPGEWMVNTQKRKIYYWPADGKPGDDIFAPALRELIRVEGRNDQKGNADQPVTGICFLNLNFTKADRGVWDADDAGIQHDWEMVDKDNAMLRFRGAKNCRVEKCHFYNAGGNAIRLDLYAQEIAVENCLFNNLGQSAVMMIGYGLGTKDVNKKNRVFNNHIHHCGEIYWHSQMITAFQSGDNYIGHNYIHDVPRKAICISGIRAHWLEWGETDRREVVNTIRWDEIGDAKAYEEIRPFLHSRNNIVEYNDIHDVVQKMGDGSAINLSAGGPGNIIRFNYIHDIPASHASAGIRMDGSQTEALIENNIIVNLGVAGVIPKMENNIRNNFFIQTSKNRYAMVRAMGLNGGLANFERNILYNTYPNRLFFNTSSMKEYSKEDFAKRTIDNNVYFSPIAKESDFSDLAWMKSQGADKHSVYGDPMFVDWENRNFTLKSDSPALSLGIK